MRPLPAVLRISRTALERGDRLGALIGRRLRPAPATLARTVAAFAFKNDERRFALDLLRRRPQFWVFRSNQRAFCGDFVLVDMSCPRLDKRSALVVDLKRGAHLRAGRGVGAQLSRAARAVDEVARSSSALAVGAQFGLLIGDARAVFDFLGDRATRGRT